MQIGDEAKLAEMGLNMFPGNLHSSYLTPLLDISVLIK